MLKFLRLLAWSFISIATAIALLGGGAYWLYNDAQAPGPLAAAKTLVIPARSGVSGIAEVLEAAGVIRHSPTFVAFAELSGRGKALKPGEYEFPTAASTAEAIDIIASGRTVKHRLTIPEGLTSPEVMALLSAAPALDGDPGPTPPEGTLLPDTYVYSYGDSRKAMLGRMQRAMTQVVAEIWGEHRADIALNSAHDAVVLASIVEKETARPEERPHVAGVYINRLRLGMRLQADPTVLYALSDNGTKKLERPLTRSDLTTDSPYNTYVIKGLPPEPIDNPSRASLRAAVRPERTDDLYFVADNTGGHIFAKTLPEQARNVAQYHRGGPVEPDVLPAPEPEPVPAPATQAEPERTRQVLARPPAPPPPHKPRIAEQTARLHHCREGAPHCPAPLR